MLIKLLKFEIYWQLKQPIVWVGFIALMLMAFLASVTTIDFGAGSQVNINSPFAIMVNMLMFAGLSSFFVPAIAANAALRDENNHMEELVFSKPVRRQDLFLSRYGGTFIASMVMFCGAAVGLLGAELGPFSDATKLGETKLEYYLFGLVVLALPSILFSSSLYFFIARLTRSVAWLYVVVIAIVAMFPLHQALYSIDTRDIVTQTDSMGVFAFLDATRYWSVFERNNQMVEMSGLLLKNRLTWTGIGLFIIAAGYLSFHPRLKQNASKKKRPSKVSQTPALCKRPQLQQIKTPALAWFIQYYRFELKATGFSLIYFAILVIFSLNLLMGANNYIGNFEGAAQYPTTAFMLARIKESYLFSIYLLIIFYSALIVHRHKDVSFNALIDVMPISNGIRLMSQYAVLMTLIITALLTAFLTSVLIQLLYGFNDIKVGVYLWDLLVNHGISFYLLAGFALVLQLLFNHKYLAMLATTILILTQTYAAELGIEHYLLHFDIAPAPYSDMNGFGHFVQAHGWYSTYWLLGLGCTLMLVSKIYPRGIDSGVLERIKHSSSFASDKRQYLLPIMFAIVGGFVFYNTNVLNDYQSKQQHLVNLANSEKYFSSAQKWPQLSVSDVTLEVDLYPNKLEVSTSGKYQLVNNTSETINKILLRIAPHLDTESLQLSGAKMSDSYPQLGYYLFESEKGYYPGEQATLSFTTRWLRKGFKNHGESINLLENGSFFRPDHLMPRLGYLAMNKITDKHHRLNHGLDELQRMPTLESKKGLNTTYLGNISLVNYSAIISTSAEQNIISSGNLIRRWQQDERHFFHYKSEHPIGFMFPIMSGDYQRKTAQYKQTELAIYYHKGHEANTDVMLQAMQDSLAYYSNLWGDYPHSSLSIVEYPGYRSNAMSLPGVIPFSESHGFAADVTDNEKLNQVYFTTAHEVAHQWWANQLIGANVQGAMLLTESIAQYAALQVVEKRFGLDMVQKFKRYELNNYLSKRSSEQQHEMPLLRVEQEYVAYHKGALVLDAIKVLIGESAFNQALSQFFAENKYTISRYPTSKDLLRHIINLTPIPLVSQVNELLSETVLFDASVSNLRVLDVSTSTAVNVSVDVMIKRWSFEGTGKEKEEHRAVFSSLAFYDINNKLLAEVPVTAGSDLKSIAVELPSMPDKVRIDPQYLILDKVPQNNLTRLK